MLRPLLGGNMSSDDVNHFAGNVRWPQVSAGVAKGQMRVIEPQQVQHRGKKVMHVNGMLAMWLPMSSDSAQDAVCGAYALQLGH